MACSNPSSVWHSRAGTESQEEDLVVLGFEAARVVE